MAGRIQLKSLAELAVLNTEKKLDEGDNKVSDGVEHKPLPVSGYTPQSNANIELVNRNKDVEELVLRIIDDLDKGDRDVDPHWLEVGRTHIEQGFMALNRAIMQPKRKEGDLEHVKKTSNPV